LAAIVVPKATATMTGRETFDQLLEVAGLIYQ